LEIDLKREASELQDKFEDQRNETQKLVWPEISRSIVAYDNITKSKVANEESRPTLLAFLQLFDTIAKLAKFQKVRHIAQPVPVGVDPQSLLYFASIYQQASAARTCLDDFGKRVVSLSHKSLGECDLDQIKWSLGPLKTVDRCVEKTMDAYGGNFQWLGDIARGSFQCKDLASLCIVLKTLISLQSEGVVELVRCKNRLDPNFHSDAGYRDGLINAILRDGPPGHICEIQVHMTAFMKVKHEGGHASYKAARALHLADPELLTHR